MRVFLKNKRTKQFKIGKDRTNQSLRKGTSKFGKNSKIFQFSLSKRIILHYLSQKTTKNGMISLIIQSLMTTFLINAFICFLLKNNSSSAKKNPKKSLFNRNIWLIIILLFVTLKTQNLFQCLNHLICIYLTSISKFILKSLTFKNFSRIKNLILLKFSSVKLLSEKKNTPKSNKSSFQVLTQSKTKLYNSTVMSSKKQHFRLHIRFLRVVIDSDK